MLTSSVFMSLSRLIFAIIRIVDLEKVSEVCVYVSVLRVEMEGEKVE